MSVGTVWVNVIMYNSYSIFITASCFYSLIWGKYQDMLKWDAWKSVQFVTRIRNDYNRKTTGTISTYTECAERQKVELFSHHMWEKPDQRTHYAYNSIILNLKIWGRPKLRWIATIKRMAMRCWWPDWHSGEYSNCPQQLCQARNIW